MYVWHGHEHFSGESLGDPASCSSESLNEFFLPSGPQLTFNALLKLLQLSDQLMHMALVLIGAWL